MKHPSHNYCTGFSLIELLVVIAIISLLASAMTSTLIEVQAKALDTTRVTTLKSMATALERYRNDHGAYPSTGATLDGDHVFAHPDCVLNVNTKTQEWIPGLVSGGYTSRLPTDPEQGEGACYLYTSDGRYFVLSFWDSRPKTEQRYTPETNPLYSLAGFREYNEAWTQWCLYNHPNLGIPGHPLLGNHNFYAESFTITNLPDTTTPVCTVP